MAEESLPKTNPNSKNCPAPGCWFRKNYSGYCAFHNSRLKHGIPFDRPKYARAGTLVGRNRDVILAYVNGKSIRLCAKHFGVSSQRIQQILRDNKVNKSDQDRRLSYRLVRLYQLGNEIEACALKLGLKVARTRRLLSVWRKSLSKAERDAKRLERELNCFQKAIAAFANQEGCWEWQGTRNPVTGYGRAKLRGKWYGAHRVSFEIHNGYEPSLHILHSCDNPPCVNPKHLREGTMAENMADRDRRGRAAWQKDYDGWLKRLTEARRNRTTGTYGKVAWNDVLEIRRRYKSGERAVLLAAEFKVHRATVTRIARGYCYKYVQ